MEEANANSIACSVKCTEFMGSLGSFQGCSAEGLCAVQATLEASSMSFIAYLQASPFPGPALHRAFQLMGSSALVSWHTKDNSKYSLSAATAASVSMSISHPHCALCFESALAVNNAFIHADNRTKLLVNV